MKKGEKIATESVGLRERIRALSNIPKLLKMVWETNPYLTVTTIVTRIILSALPVAILYIGKLFINEVVMLIHSSDKTLSHAYLWKLVAIEFALVITSNALNRVILLIDVLLGDRLSNYSFMRIMSHASKLDLEKFEDAFFYDNLERARQQCIGLTTLL